VDRRGQCESLIEIVRNFGPIDDKGKQVNDHSRTQARESRAALADRGTPHCQPMSI
jgi:hypothetical protein